MAKLPRYVRQRRSGSYEFRRNVPKDLVEELGKSHVYCYLGNDYRGMLLALPEVERETELVFRQSRAKEPREKTLLMVRQHFGDQAAEILADIHPHDEPKVIQSGSIGCALPPLPLEVSTRTQGVTVSLAEAFKVYGDFTGASNNVKLANSLRRTERDLLNALGANKVQRYPIQLLSRADAAQYRDELLQRVSANSVARYITIAKAVINFAISEKGINAANPFHNLRIKGAGSSQGDRLPMSKGEAEAVLAILPHQTDLHAIYTLLCDTGVPPSGGPV